MGQISHKVEALFQEMFENVQQSFKENNIDVTNPDENLDKANEILHEAIQKEEMNLNDEEMKELLLNICEAISRL